MQTSAIVIYKEGNQTFEFKVSEGQTILEAGNAAGISMSYSCQAGLCTACMVKCTEGSVQMSETESLSSQEIEMGYILTCVSYPTSERVIIEN